MGYHKSKLKLLDLHPALDAALLRHARFWVFHTASPLVLMFSITNDGETMSM